MSLFSKFRDKVKQTVFDAQRRLEQEVWVQKAKESVGKTAAEVKRQWAQSGIEERVKEVAKRAADAVQNIAGVSEVVALQRYRRARQLCEQGLHDANVEGVIADLEMAVKVDSYFRADAYRLLARAYDVRGRHDDAMHTYRQAIELLRATPAVGAVSQWLAEEYNQHVDAYTCEVYVELGALYERLQHYDAAVWYARDCLAIDERHLPAYHVLTSCLVKQGRADEARDALRRAAIHDRHGIVTEWEKEMFGE